MIALQAAGIITVGQPFIEEEADSTVERCVDNAKQSGEAIYKSKDQFVIYRYPMLYMTAYARQYGLLR